MARNSRKKGGKPVKLMDLMVPNIEKIPVKNTASAAETPPMNSTTAISMFLNTDGSSSSSEMYFTAIRIRARPVIAMNRPMLGITPSKTRIEPTSPSLFAWKREAMCEANSL